MKKPNVFLGLAIAICCLTVFALSSATSSESSTVQLSEETSSSISPIVACSYERNAYAKVIRGMYATDLSVIDAKTIIQKDCWAYANTGYLGCTSDSKATVEDNWYDLVEDDILAFLTGETRQAVLDFWDTQSQIVIDDFDGF